MKTKSNLNWVIKVSCIVTMLSLVISPFGAGIGQVTAQAGEPADATPQEETPEALALKALGASLTYDTSGTVRFVNFEDPGKVVPRPDAISADASRPAAARGFLAAYGAVFGVRDANQDLTILEDTATAKGGYVHFQQTYQGIPVIGGELIVQVDASNNIRSANGELALDPGISTSATLDAATAVQTAVAAVARWYSIETSQLSATPPELWVYDPGLIGPAGDPVQLVWRLEVSAIDLTPVREFVLVNAQQGGIPLHFSQIDNLGVPSQPQEETPTETVIEIPTETPPDVLDLPATATPAEGLSDTTGEALQVPPSAEIVNALTPPQFLTYTANNASSLPGTLVCNQTQPTCTNGANPDADDAHVFALDTYNYFATNFNRDSLNNGGMSVISTVDFCQSSCPYNNAFWSGAQMVYGGGTSTSDALGYSQADDVVGHELTHGVTQFESHLFYYYQSGAINESFSDVFGEFMDQTNSRGTDTAEVKWKIGEDLPGGAIRDMANPGLFSNPDKMTSTNYYEGPLDSGGVHTNSGVNNKAAVLMVDGGTFNGKTVTALGLDKTAHIYYEAATNLLTSGSDYLDLYNALYQACQSLVGQHSISAADCSEVRDATQAVEMQLQPATNFNSDVALCPANTSPLNVFFDDLESGSANWTFGKLNGDTYTRWQYDSPWGPYAHSGLHHLFGDDSPAAVSDSYAAMNSSVVVPASAYLHFYHAYGFEDNGSNYYDGGVLEYSTNGGSTWTDAGGIMETPNKYNGLIINGLGNPLDPSGSSQRSAFVGDSHGYISTKVNLGTLSGQSIRFRWRMGLDATIIDWGWWVDDVRIYRCVNTALANSVLPTSRTTTVGSTVTIYNTVINGGSFYADDVTLSMANPPPGTFKYQQSSCSDNSLIGPDNPVLDIPAGGIVCYVLSFTPSATFNATDVHIRAQAANAPATGLLTGINTWLLRATDPASPDMVALTTTVDFHQVPCSGTQYFAVAISNVGAAASQVTATADFGSASLPLAIVLSETNPATGVVIGDHVLENVGPGEIRSVLVQVTFNGCIAFDPATKRIFIRFRDAGNNIVGSTSTAVSTNR